MININIPGRKPIEINNNDIDMLRESILSIAVVYKEGCASKALFSADIVVYSSIDGIDMILKPERIKATLRT